jgi:hypothetical protein
MKELPIMRYPDEPNPSDKFAWKAWWVKKCFPPEQPLTEGAIKWINECWKSTAARWNL